jgi:hypothetical protein
MAKFEFPVTEAEFMGALTAEGKKLLATKLKSADASFAWSCCKLGWTNKMFHKEKQGRDREDLKKVRAALKADPKLAERLKMQS